MKRQAILIALVMALATGSVTQSASACGLEGGLGDAFSAAHEGSLDVAFATREAITSGWLIPDPALETEAAHDRADERLQMFAAALPVAPRGAKPFAVLLVEPGVWTRVSPKAGRWSLAIHVEKPSGSEVTVLASEPALRNLIAGQLSADKALSSGVLIVRGEIVERDRLIATLLQIYPERKITTAFR
jgi:hypothetical protein